MDVRELECINGIAIESDQDETITITKGAWSPQEDSILINYIAVYGEGRWNHLALNSGLKRTGKSCRMRWKNYLHPNVRRGNFTLVEQLYIIKLHCLYGNRWSKIAEFLPGRTDNEVKNYWRTRVQKQAKLLKYDVNSTEFQEFILNVWLPTLSEQIHCSNLDDVVTNTNGLGPIMNGPIQMDNNWASLSGTLAAEAHHGSVMDSLSGLYNGLDCLQSPYIQGISNPAWLSSCEWSDSDMLDWFWPTHE